MDTSAESTTLPIGLASFAGGFAPVRRVVHRDHENVVSRHEYAVGSHHAAHQVPDVVVAHPRGFCRDLLAGHVDS